ncbi:NifB/NifX family molybdenum-iron cluster-binding protein [Aliivibrio fischeri]|uniref:NifB/NifX family molybdenum-iron cluster-binding protein n=1 Tax=Aliivibrio fischeri TaxID=668 RepID=UPI0009081522|nr:NifB/NifX family molybdenum-iron cluster-binding protein [Aliivibrio fischeri]MUK25753.1 hypothetical protein [Aliivibrio fischeri]MUK34282.1 hypothetical protein [Aliivibrio fischeri]
MKFAIPYQNGRIAGHFSKAESFLFTDKEHSEITPNPALNSTGCGGKKSLLSLLKSQQIDALVVRNIGQKMLGNLLKSNIRVFHAKGNASLNNAAFTDLPELTDATQGRPCKNTKQGCCSKKQNVMTSKLTAPSRLKQTFTVLGCKA